MKKLIIMLLFVSGCSSMPGFPGHISESVSSYDGTKQLNISPAFISADEWTIKFALVKNSRWEKDRYLLTVYVRGGTSIYRDNALHLIVDGKEYHFSASDELTDFKAEYGSLWSFRDFEMTRTFLENMVNGNDVRVKVDTKEGYVTGIFTNVPGAKPSFREFLKRADNL